MSRLFCLAIVPIAWLGLAAMALSAAGSFSPIDPDYHYLLSSLDFAELRPIGIYHHPGTTAEAVGTLVMLAVRAVARSAQDVQTAVLTDPEFFMRAINIVSAFLNAAGFFALGLLAWRATNNLGLSVLIQASPLLSGIVPVESLARFKPEPFMLLGCLAAIGAVTRNVFSPNGRRSVTGWAIINGFGLATKFTFLPVAVIPVLLLRKGGAIVRLALGTAVATLIFTLPIANRYLQLGSWINTVTFHTGIYGQGAEGLVDLQSYRASFATMFTQNLALFAAVLIALAAVVAGHVRRRTSHTEPDPELAALTALLASHALAFVLVAKYYLTEGASRYLFTSHALAGLTLILAVRLLARHLAAWPPLVSRTAAVMLAILIVVDLSTAGKQVSYSMENRAYARTHSGADAAMIDELLKPFDGHARILDVSIWSSKTGMLQASFYSVDQQPALGRIYHDWFLCGPGCTESNWTTQPLTGFDAKPRTAAAIAKQFNGRIVLISGPTIAVHAITSQP